MQYHGENDALALEYKLEYGCATRNLDIPDVVDDPLGQRVSGALGLSFQKKLLDLCQGVGCNGSIETRPPEACRPPAVTC